MSRTTLSVVLATVFSLPLVAQNSDEPSARYQSFTSSFPDDPALFDQFGEVIDISGDTMIVGVPDKQPAVSEEGAVYLMQRNQGGAGHWGEWEQLDRPVFAERIISGYGSAVAIDGDTAAVAISSYERTTGDSRTRQGIVVIYERNSSRGAWREVALIYSPDDENSQGFGADIDLCNDTLIVGAPGKDEGAPDQGAAYLFERNSGGADDWGFVAKLTDPLGGEDHELGSAVAIDGEIAAAGAPGDLALAFSGLVLTFQRNRWDWGSPAEPSADNWGLEARIPAPNSGEEAFGYDLALQDDFLVVGQRFYGVEERDAGAAFLYQRQAPGAGSLWTRVRDFLPENPESGDRFGSSVDLDGDIIVVGAPGRPGFDLYHRNTGGPDQWGLTQSNDSDGRSSNRFGEAVAISGATVVAGEPEYFENPGAIGGRVLVYELLGPEWLQCLPSLRARHAPAKNASMGWDVDIHGDYALIGGRGFAHLLRRNHNPDSPENPEYEEWGIVTTLTAPPDADPLAFGREVALTASHAAVADNESVHLFDRDFDGSNATPVADAWGHRLFLEVIPDDNYTMGDIALDGDTLIVGRPSGPQVSGLLIYTRNEGGADQWGQVAGIGRLGDTFGTSVDLSNDTAVVGRGEEGGGMAFAIIFERNEGGPDNWGSVATLPQGEGIRPDVAIDQDTLAVGRPFPNAEGEVALYERNTGGAENWGAVTMISDPLGFSNTLFGKAVDLAADKLVVGTPNLGIDQSRRLGRLYFFDRNRGGADSWGLSLQAVPYARGNDRNFGWAVATNGVHAVTGAPQNKLGTPVLTGLAGDVAILRWDRTPYWDWVTHHFDPDDYEDPLRHNRVWGPSADPDDDDLSNHWEQIIQSDPTSADSGPEAMPRSGGARILDGNGIALTSFPADSRLEIQFAPDFGKETDPWRRAALFGRSPDWESAPDFEIDSPSPESPEFSVTFNPPLPFGRGFFRARLERR